MIKSLLQKLSLEEKGKIVFTQAQYIGVRDYYNQKINLYSLDDFFIEVWYSPAKNKIAKIEAVEAEKVLDRYINFMKKLKK